MTDRPLLTEVCATTEPGDFEDNGSADGVTVAMPRVHKFGGTSVDGAERLKALAAIIRDQEGRSVVVVSAMAGVSNELSGLVDVAVSYSGPAASFVTLSVDGMTRFITNFPPYGFRWDTTTLSAGTHTVRVRVYGSENNLLVDQISAFTIGVPGADQPRDEPASDL